VKNLNEVALGLAIAVLFVAPPLAQDKKTTETKVPELTELSKLKAENFQLKIQVTQCRVDVNDREAKLASVSLSSEQLKLIEEFRKELKADKEDEFDWQTLTFKKKAKDEKVIK
jgi:hypothetical protein